MAVQDSGFVHISITYHCSWFVQYLLLHLEQAALSDVENGRLHSVGIRGEGEGGGGGVGQGSVVT